MGLTHFVIICETKKEAESMHEKLKPYLKKRGLELASEKLIYFSINRRNSRTITRGYSLGYVICKGIIYAKFVLLFILERYVLQ
ncbi:hypothetical protein CON35_28845 [Bacillus cereus]|nr:hypothetical protein CON35_28845 [Bacillus cereus]